VAAVQPGDSERALLAAFFEVIRDGAIDRLPAILADDYEDGNPIRGQLPGRTGIALKVLGFRATHPGAEIVVEAIEVAPPGLRVTWVTTAPGLGGDPGESSWRYRGEFTIEGGKLKSGVVVSEERA
jgi:hypothetical protein